MVHIFQPTDLDSTLNVLKQEPTSISPAVAISLIERWEEQLQETHFFEQLSELKQAILEGRATAIANLLKELGEATCATVAHVHDYGAATVEVKVDQLGQALSQAGQSVRDSL